MEFVLYQNLSHKAQAYFLILHTMYGTQYHIVWHQIVFEMASLKIIPFFIMLSL